jgi:hypothetical protein
MSRLIKRYRAAAAPTYPPSGTILATHCTGVNKYNTVANGSGGSNEVLVEANAPSCGYVAPTYPPAGTVLNTYCTGYDKYETRANGSGGSTNVLVQSNSSYCGYTPPPPAGTVLATHCTGFDKYNIVANGSGGSSEVLVQANSTDCGYVPPSNPPAGTVLNTYCTGYDKYETRANGSGGSTNVLVQTNSSYCGYVPPPAAGTVLATHCVGVDKYETRANGTGGSYEVLVEANAPSCGYTPPPPAAGTVLNTYCTGFDKYETRANGTGGSYNVLVQTNSPYCGYVPPPAAGTVLRTYCSGFDKYETRADGSGGSINVLIETNSAYCGYSSPFVAIPGIPDVSASRLVGSANASLTLSADGTWTTSVVSNGSGAGSGRYLVGSASGLEIFVSSSVSYDYSLGTGDFSCSVPQGSWQAFSGASMTASEASYNGAGFGVYVNISLREAANHSSTTSFGLALEADGACFAYGTVLRTQNGDRKVEDLIEGDVVIGFSEPSMVDASVEDWQNWTVGTLAQVDTGVLTTVAECFHFDADRSVIINGVHMTYTHYCFVFDGNKYCWKRAKDIKITDSFVNASKELVQITDIQTVIGTHSFVRLNVESNDTVQVKYGASYLLMHNQS